MRQLILMRHGKAEAGAAGQGDHGRGLTARGRAEALEAARRLAALAHPDAALVSDSTRTRQTIESALPALPAALPCRFTRSLYGATPEAILAEVRTTPPDVSCLLVIGHNPGMGDLARRLAAEGDPQALARLAAGFPTSCFALLELATADWATVGTPGRLRFLLPADERSGA